MQAFLILLLGFMTMVSHAAKDEIKVVGIDFYPFTKVNDDGSLEGIGLELIKEVAKAANVEISSAYGVTTPRMLLELKEPNRVSTLTARTPEREDKFYWLGEFFVDKTCFINLNTMKPINTIEEAKKLKTIGVNKGGATEAFLIKNNFTNLEPILINRKNAQKLNLGRVDAIYSSSWVGYHSIKLGGGDPDQFQCGAPIEKVSYHLAASLNTPPKLLKKLSAELAKAVKAKAVDRILKAQNLQAPTWK